MNATRRELRAIATNVRQRPVAQPTAVEWTAILDALDGVLERLDRLDDLAYQRATAAQEAFRR